MCRYEKCLTFPKTGRVSLPKAKNSSALLQQYWRILLKPSLKSFTSIHCYKQMWWILSNISNLDSWAYLNVNYLQQFSLWPIKLFFPPNIRVVFASEKFWKTNFLIRSWQEFAQKKKERKNSLAGRSSGWSVCPALGRNRIVLESPTNFIHMWHKHITL